MSEVKYFTYFEVAKILRCSERTVYNRVRSGELQPFYNGRKVLFTEDCIREFLEKPSPPSNPREVQQNP